MHGVLKVALLGALFLAYAAPEDVLELADALLSLLNAHADVSPVETDREASARALRTLLTLAVTAASLWSAVSPELIVVSCVHAALHFLSSHRAGDAHEQRAQYLITHAKLENALLASFLLLLRYVWFPPASTLASFQRHRANLASFFARHDKKYVPYVDRLLEDHVGHERLLYARIRRLYRWRSAQADTELIS